MTTEAIPSFEVPAAQEIPAYSVDNFKAHLLELHNQLLPAAPLTDFDANKNYMGQGIAGAMDGAAIRYPKRSDKMELLAYAVEEAQKCEDPRDGALLLAASVVATHPFVDGNGRVSRALYSDLMGVERSDEISSARNFDSGDANRQRIDLGTAFTQDEWLSRWSAHYPYLLSGVPHEDLRVVIYKKDIKDDIEATTLTEDALSGLDTEERVDLVSAIGADEFGNTYATDLEGLMFAAALLVKNFPDLKDYVKPQGKGSIINIHELLPSLAVEQKKKFVAALWQYRKFRAQAVIDFLSDETGSEVITAGGRIAVRSLVIERTNNLHASKLRGSTIAG